MNKHPDSHKHIENEITILSKKEIKSNKNIVKFIELVKGEDYLYMVYEYCNEGNLEEHLSHKGMLSEYQKVCLIQ